MKDLHIEQRNKDERLAVEVMGWHESQYLGVWLDANDSYVGFRVPYFSEGANDWQPSQNIEQAFMVVEKMRERGLYVEINGYSDGDWMVEFIKDRKIIGDGGVASTLALAIVDAVIAVLDGEK